MFGNCAVFNSYSLLLIQNSIHLFALTILRSSCARFSPSFLQTRSFAIAIVRECVRVFFNLFVLLTSFVLFIVSVFCYV